MALANKYLINTDVLIDYLKNVASAVTFLENKIEDSVCYLSVITVTELYADVREGKERQILERFINSFEIIPLNSNIAIAGGLYRRDYGKSHGVGIADAIIAATAIDCDANLITLNKKHFPMLKNKIVPYSK